MALKIMSFILVISAAFGITTPNQVQNVSFDVNDVINRVSAHHSQPVSQIPNPKSQTPALTGEFMIDTNIIYTPEPDNQLSPSVAFDGTNYLVVWEDHLSRADTSNIYGARVTQTGQLLDTAGLPISNAAYYQSHPSIAFDGTNFLVVWQDDRGGNLDIYGTRISQMGQVLDTAGIQISTEVDDQASPAIIFESSAYFVVWQDSRNRMGTDTSDIYGSRVTPSGQVLDPAGIQISNAIETQVSPSVAFDGTNYLVVWQDTRTLIDSSDIYGARVTQSGQVLDTTGIPISTTAYNQYLPVVAFDGTNYLVVWETDHRYSRVFEIFGSRVSQSGQVLDPAGIPINTDVDEDIYPSVAFDGNNYLVVWHHARWGYNYIFASRVTPSGQILDGFPITNAADYYRPAVIFDGINYVAVWVDYRSELTDDIYGCRITPNGQVLDSTGILITIAVNSQQFPSVAFDGTNYLVVWEDHRKPVDTTDIYGARVTPAGQVLDPAGILISTVAYPRTQHSVIFGSNNYLVVWEDYRNNPYTSDIYGARITPGGQVLDPSSIQISSGGVEQRQPSVAFDGSNFFVVWRDFRRMETSTSGIFGSRVTQSGQVLDPSGLMIADTGRHKGCPSIAFGDTNYLVVWQEVRSSWDIYGSRVTRNGGVLDRNGIPISTATNHQMYPAIAFDGTNYLAVWQDSRNSNFSDIYGARVTQAGTVLDTNGNAISTAIYNQNLPTVTFDGTNYLVVWENESNNSYDIYGAKVNIDGNVIDSFAISVQPGGQYAPTLTKGSENQVLITYSSFTDSINHHSAFTYRIWGKLYPGPGIEENRQPLPTNRIPLEIYPNPTRSYLAVLLPNTADCQMVKIFDVSGKLVKEEKVLSAQEHKQEVKISLKGIIPGIYFLRLGKETKKFLVVK